MWESGKTYGFLLKAEPSPAGSRLKYTDYTAWFKDPEEGWKLIATWRRPTESLYLTGLYSFAENFSEQSGDKTRTCYYGNQWAHEKDAEWHESTKGVGTGGKNKPRSDVEVGVDDTGNRYYIKHIGFFNTDFQSGK